MDSSVTVLFSSFDSCPSETIVQANEYPKKKITAVEASLPGLESLQNARERTFCLQP